MAKKSATGIGEMLSNLMGSSSFADTAARMDNIQSSRPHLAVVVNPVVVPDPVIEDVIIEDLSIGIDQASTTILTTISTTDSTSKQASESTNKQANKQVNKQASQQAGKRASKQVSHSATEPATGQVSKHPDEQVIQQVIKQEDRLPEQQPVQQVFRQPVQQPDQQPVAIKSIAEDFLALTTNQGALLQYLYNAGGLTNMEQICGDTGIAYGTARSALQVLQREGYLLSKKQFNGHTFRGFSFDLNNNLCAIYLNRLQQPNQQQIQQPVRQAQQQPHQQASRQVGKQAGNPLEEVEDFETKENLLTSSKAVGGIDLDSPELQWWESIGLTVAKTAEWLREFQEKGLSSKDLTNSLKFAWYDAAINKIKPGGRQIDNYFNWFYKYLPGGYPAPVNYKSFIQVLIENERAELETIENEMNQLADIRRKRAEAEKELTFQRFLSTPDSAEYQTMYEKVSSFAKESGGIALELALKDEFLAKKWGN